MYRQGEMELQSSGWLQSRIGDRPAFQAVVSRGFASQNYHVFLLPQGFLFLQPTKPSRESGDAARQAMVAGAVMGGLVGAAIGAAVGSAMTKKAEDDENFDLCANEQLFSLAKSRKGSFVSVQEEIRSVLVNAPGTLSRLFGGSVAGWIIVKDSRQGKITIEVKDQNSLSAAVDAIPRRFKERASVNVRWDDAKLRFVPK